jgi:heme/copper-type cytochrome/quinol oxidase subunit 1
MNYIVLAYSIYLPIAVTLTVWVARTLHTNGKVFLVDIFHGQNELAISVNKLLQVGFYLISLGFAIIKLEITPDRTYDQALNQNIAQQINNSQAMIEELSYKLGSFILILGLMLFINLFLLLILRNSSRSKEEAAFIASKKFEKITTAH